jgi:small GTP-binding protein
MNSTIRFILFGHVDHGKSTLAGHLLAKVGKFSDHDIEKAHQDSITNKMSGWKWAYLLDHGLERVKGKTYEYTIEKFEYKGKQYELLDTPGHRSFIREMIEATVSYTDLTGVLVISVLENEFISGMENGNTKEHLIICRGSGIKNLIVCLNKIDLVNPEQISNVKEKLNNFIKTLQFKSVVYLETSAFKGINLLNILDNLKESSSSEELQYEELSSNKFKCKCKFLEINMLISSGFKCMLHTKNLEIPIEIDKIKGQKIIKNGNVTEFKFTTEHPIKLYVNQKIILRDTKSIAFGVILG